LARVAFARVAFAAAVLAAAPPGLAAESPPRVSAASGLPEETATAVRSARQVQPKLLDLARRIADLVASRSVLP